MTGDNHFGTVCSQSGMLCLAYSDWFNEGGRAKALPFKTGGDVENEDYYRGKRLDKMTKEELIAALKTMNRLYQLQLQEHQDEIRDKLIRKKARW